MSTTTIVPLAEQVRQALAEFQTAHEDAERKIAAAATLKLTVGTNEADRKRQAASIPADEYSGYVASLAEAERDKAAAVAACERSEKNLNVLRELLGHEIAAVNRATAELADRTAMRYAALQMAPPARPMIMRNIDPNNIEVPF